MTTFALALTAWFLLSVPVGSLIGALLRDPNDVEPY